MNRAQSQPLRHAAFSRLERVFKPTGRRIMNRMANMARVEAEKDNRVKEWPGGEDRPPPRLSHT